MDALLRIMRSVYLPLILNNTTWPDEVRKDCSGQAHKFMASLVEAVHERQGQTVLYVPDEPGQT